MYICILIAVFIAYYMYMNLAAFMYFNKVSTRKANQEQEAGMPSSHISLSPPAFLPTMYVVYFTKSSTWIILWNVWDSQTLFFRSFQPLLSACQLVSGNFL